MSLLQPRQVFAPFEYEEAYQYWLQQQQAHWLHTEVPMASDISDWKTKLTETEKKVVGSVLKGFTQTEVIVGDYWSQKVAKWFKKPEIAMMALTFSAFETIHMKAYAYLNESLGLEDYAAFLSDETVKAKIDRLVEVEGNSKEDIAKSLAIFSGFTEGVNLFSSFAILLSFMRFNKLKGVGQIVSWSIRDESLHSRAGCWLFRQLIKENPEIWTDELKKEIYEAARLSVKLEDEFIDKAFEAGSIEGLDASDLKQFIRYRANTKLQDLNLKSNWKNLDKEAVHRVSSWFEALASGLEHGDFFATRVTTYSKGTVDWGKIFDEE